MVDTVGKAFRHPVAGRLFPGRGFAIGGISFPPNWLELATSQDLQAHGIEISTDASMTEEDLRQEERYLAFCAKRERQIQELHEAIGRYAVAFEHMVDAVRRMCIIITTANSEQQQLMNIVFYHKSMSAWPLFELFYAMIGHIVSQRCEGIDQNELVAIKGVLKHINKRYQTACNDRNDHLHATWLIGFGNEATEGFSEAAIIRGKVTAEGLKYLPGPKSVKDLDSLTAECEEIKDLVYRFYGSLMWHDGPRVSKNFQRVEEGWVAIRPR